MATKAITRYRTRVVKVRSRRRSSSMGIPVFPLAGLAVGMAPVIKEMAGGNMVGAGRLLQYFYTPWDPWSNKFSVAGMRQGMLPLVTGILIHKYIGGKLGLNRSLAQAGVPLIRF